MSEQHNIIRDFGVNYTSIPSDILHDKDVSLKAKGLYSLIMGLPHDWKLSLRGIAEIVKEDYGTVRRIMLELINKGYVEREDVRYDNGRYMSVVYHIKPSPKAQKPLMQNASLENALNNIEHNNIKHNNKEKSKKKDYLDSIPDGDMKDVFTEWLEYKRQTGKAYKTEIGYKRAYSRLCKLSDNNDDIAREIIDQSISNNYDGLFPIKHGTKQHYTANQREADAIARQSSIIQGLQRCSTKE